MFHYSSIYKSFPQHSFFSIFSLNRLILLNILVGLKSRRYWKKISKGWIKASKASDDTKLKIFQQFKINKSKNFIIRNTTPMPLNLKIFIQESVHYSQTYFQEVY